jgi:transcriptional regulator with XRE-family HTH domain
MTLSSDDDRMLATLSAQLRALRIERDWTLADLAMRTALSQAHLSRIESGDRQPSLATLFTLARAFEIPVASLLETAPASDAAVVIRAGSAPAHRVNELLLTPLSSTNRQLRVQAARVQVPAERSSTERYQHEGEEWLYVLSGTLQLFLGSQTYFLQAGDAAHFDASVPHRLAAPCEALADVLIVTSSGTRLTRPAHT